MSSTQMTIPRFTVARMSDDAPDEHECLLLELNAPERMYLATVLFTSRRLAQLFIDEEQLDGWKVALLSYRVLGDWLAAIVEEDNGKYALIDFSNASGAATCRAFEIEAITGLLLQADDDDDDIQADTVLLYV